MKPDTSPHARLIWLADQVDEFLTEAKKEFVTEALPGLLLLLRMGMWIFLGYLLHLAQRYHHQDAWITFKTFLKMSVIYASFMEWFIHKYLLHKDWGVVLKKHLSRYPWGESILKKYEKLLSSGWISHAIWHHIQKRTGLRFSTQEPEPPADYEVGKTSSMHRVFIAHLPLFLLIGWTWSWPAGFGFALGSTTYLALYELLHWAMHNQLSPQGRFLYATPVIGQYLWVIGELHRMHHKKSTINYGVVSPIADLMLGTLTLIELEHEPPYNILLTRSDVVRVAKLYDMEPDDFVGTYNVTYQAAA